MPKQYSESEQRLVLRLIKYFQLEKEAGKPLLPLGSVFDEATMVQENNYSNLENDPSIRFGKILAHPPPGEEIVISGMSGVFPLSDNIDDFKKNLDNKIEMITQTPRIHPEIPTGVGKFNDSTRFDTGFFDLHSRHALTLSPMCKMLLEKCYECIFDAGLHPSDLEGTKTGVFLGVSFSESEIYWYLQEHIQGGNAIMGNEKSVYANRISHHLRLKGPSFVADTACSSSAYALESAFRAIRMGECDAALVGGSNVVLAGGCSLQFARLGVLSPDGHCRPFDIDGTGYVRSEATTVILLQKAKDSKRIYATLVHTKTNCDGYKEQGITYPSGMAQYNLLKEIYTESGIKPYDMSYIEAHGTGTIVGDPEELNSMDEFFTPGRKTPLLVGSVKSSIGHSEPVSALCSMVKVILAFESNIISPNVNYVAPRKTIVGILEGRLEVVVENTPFRDQNGLAGVSSFGFGGGNAHAILKQHAKTKIAKGIPADNLPRLVCVSGRTEEAVRVLLDDIGKKFDAEHMGLIYNVFRKPIKNHLYRGYTIVSKECVLKKSIKSFTTSKLCLHLNFDGLSKASGNLLPDLLNLPIMESLNSRLTEFFNKKKLDLNAITSNPCGSNQIHFLAELLTQLALTELLKQLEVKWDTVLGHSFGKFVRAYLENSLSLHAFLECVYAVAKVTNEIEVIKNVNGISIESLTKYKTTLLSEFKKILPSSTQVNGYSAKSVQCPTPKYLLEAIFETKRREVPSLPKNSVILEIGQSSPLARRKHNILSLNNQSDMQGILEVLGRLFECGMQLQIQKLYPKVQFPVSRGTPMISSKIKWKHDMKHFVPSFGCNLQKRDAMVFKISLNEEEWASLEGHVIDGRNLFPATGYLYLVWIVLGELLAMDVSKLKVVFENCKFFRACSIAKPSTAGLLELRVMLQRQSGNFEIIDGDVPVVTGRVKFDESQNHVLSLPVKDELFVKDKLNRKDIYKELRLRGYNYKGLFKGLTECNKSATHGRIEWSGNWIAFMDNMLQMKILGEDTRLLFVPTSIAKLTINPEILLNEVNMLKEDDEEKTVNLPVEIAYDCGIIRTHGIEIRGLLASSIPRKKYTAVPVLEKYQFVPNQTKLALEQAVRVFMQIALENNCGLKVKAVEIIDEATAKNSLPLGPVIRNVLEDQPLVQSDITVLTAENIELDVNVENKKIKYESECTVVVGSNVLSRNLILQETINAVQETGYIISRESPAMDVSNINIPNLDILSIAEVSGEKLLFLRKNPKNIHSKPRVFIDVNCKTARFRWLEKLKEAVKKDNDVIAWCQNEQLNGIIGLVNCIRREPDCQHVRSVFICDNAPKFDPHLPFYKTQLDKNLGVNIYMNGSWGTYRHLLLDNTEEVESDHCYANSTVRGDLSSIKWIEGPLSRKTKPNSEESLIEIFYSSLNFRDVMTASGRINVDVITRDRRAQECVQGFEFSGKTLSGKRVMGMLSQGTLATLVKADNPLLWEVPDGWSLKDAATVPVVYGTCLYALVVVGRIKPSDSVLVHSGTGGIGQAAINLCLNMGCTVFTTVGTEEKRKYIKRTFPQINENHIGNSRDLSFEQMIMKATNGNGVDIILNSLAEEKLCASVRCLAKNGRFLEIGKFDLASDNHLGLLPFGEGGSYHGVMLDKLFNESKSVKEELNRLVKKFIDSGAVKPLKPTVFAKHEVEQAFRFMTTGKHMGKVLVEIRNEEVQNHHQRFKGLPRYFCDPSKTYIICGGLGGFGLELADWLVLRGAKHLVLTSRKGITTGYQEYRISLWKSYSCDVKISTQDITTRSGCENLIQQANILAPVTAIFNLAVVLQDSILPNQTEETFEASFGPKACATQHLDEVTRKMCPELRDFVVFSSVSCGRGNAGQTNYGMSNSVMERICEKRHGDGYPALAIQWGAVGDVGLVAEMQEDHVELEIGGTLQQSISNCLQVMDVLLRQSEAVIVSSMVVAEKKSSSLSGSIMEVVGAILGIRDIKSVSVHSTLAELGMDSMTGVEVKQTIEREYNIFLSPTEIRSITLLGIQELQEEGNRMSEIGKGTETVDWTSILRNLMESEEQVSCLVHLKTLSSTKDPKTLPKVIVFPGIEGVCELMQKLTEMLEVQAFGVNYISATQMDTIPKMADTLLPHIKQLLEPHQPFHILAHSCGSDVALEVLSKLEASGYQGTITFLDGSPAFLQKLIESSAGGDISDANLENMLLASISRVHISDQETEIVMGEICKCSTLDEKLRLLGSHIKLRGHFFEEFLLSCTNAAIKRLKAFAKYNPNIGKLKSKVSLFKPTFISVKFEEDDYELGQYFEQPMEIKVFDGTHVTLLQNKELAEATMKNITAFK